MKLATAITLLALSAAGSRAEGLIFVPGQGWRAAPCCRENGYPGLQGVPPREFTHGPLAPAFWGEIVPRTLAPPRMVPPPTMAPPPPRSPRPPLSRHAPVARMVPPEPEPAPMEVEALPEAAPAPSPSVVAPVAPDPMGEFCRDVPAAPPCRNRVRGQR
jgi:hypothetical protein